MSITDELKDVRGIRYATKELGEEANRQHARDDADRTE